MGAMPVRMALSSPGKTGIPGNTKQGLQCAWSRPQAVMARRRACTQPAALPAQVTASTEALTQQQLLQMLSPANVQPLLLDFPNPWASFHVQTPSFLNVLSFLLSHPLITLGLAVLLSLIIPRLWRAFIRFVVIPAGVLAAGYVVVKNPQSFSTAGSFVTGFTSDHPYVTSGVILIGLALVLSPYLLTALLVLFLATGLPRLPGPVRRFLPAPVLEIEQQLAGFDDMLREPVNNLKEQSLKLGSGLQSTGSELFGKAQSSLKQIQGGQKAPALTEKSQALPGGRS